MIHEVSSVHDCIREALGNPTGLMIASLEYTSTEVLVILVFLVTEKYSEEALKPLSLVKLFPEKMPLINQLVSRDPQAGNSANTDLIYI